MPTSRVCIGMLLAATGLVVLGACAGPDRASVTMPAMATSTSEFGLATGPVGPSPVTPTVLATGTPEELGRATPTPTTYLTDAPATPTATLVPRIATATAVAIAAATTVPLEPVAEAAAARFDSWSPGSQWVAYWLSSLDDIANSSLAMGYAPRASLHLLNAITRESCAYPELVSYDYDSQVAWLPDDQIIVYAAGGAQQGRLCQADFAPASELPAPVASGPDPALSPEGDYRAATTVISSTEAALYLSTSIVATPTGQVLNVVNWSIDQRLGGLGLGGEWADDTRFLIYETRERGPLLVEAGPGVIDVAPTLFGVPADAGWPEVVYQAVPIRGTEGKAFHIVLYAAGEEQRFPRVQLYHSETGEVEEVPYTDLWAPAASPDGRWLLLDGRPTRAGYESYALWARPVDPPRSEAHFVGEGQGLWSPDWARVAFGFRGMYLVAGFPDGTPLVAGHAVSPHRLNPRGWSPDGRWVVFEAYTGRPQEALFVVDTRAANG